MLWLTRDREKAPPTQKEQPIFALLDSRQDLTSRSMEDKVITFLCFLPDSGISCLDSWKFASVRIRSRSNAVFQGHMYQGGILLPVSNYTGNRCYNAGCTLNDIRHTNANGDASEDLQAKTFLYQNSNMYYSFSWASVTSNGGKKTNNKGMNLGFCHCANLPEQKWSVALCNRSFYVKQTCDYELRPQTSSQSLLGVESCVGAECEYTLSAVWISVSSVKSEICLVCCFWTTEHTWNFELERKCNFRYKKQCITP